MWICIAPRREHTCKMLSIWHAFSRDLSFTCTCNCYMCTTLC